MIVVALGVHAGSGVDVVSDSGAELADGDATDDGANEAGAAVHGCAALTHVVGRKAAGSGALVGNAA